MRVTAAVRRWALETASQTFGVSVKAIEGDSTLKDIAQARQYAMWLVRERRDGDGQVMHGWQQIGRAFGVHHTTALHAWKAHNRRMRQWATGVKQPPIKDHTKYLEERRLKRIEAARLGLGLGLGRAA